MTLLACLYYFIAAGIYWFIGHKTSAIIDIILLVLLLIFMWMIYRYSLISMIRRVGAGTKFESVNNYSSARDAYYTIFGYSKTDKFKDIDNRAAPKPIRYTFFALYWFSLLQIGSSLFLIIDGIILKLIVSIVILLPMEFLWKYRYKKDFDPPK